MGRILHEEFKKKKKRRADKAAWLQDMNSNTPTMWNWAQRNDLTQSVLNHWSNKRFSGLEPVKQQQRRNNKYINKWTKEEEKSAFWKLQQYVSEVEGHSTEKRLTLAGQDSSDWHAVKLNYFLECFPSVLRCAITETNRRRRKQNSESILPSTNTPHIDNLILEKMSV